jgi:hypothetical protein
VHFGIEAFWWHIAVKATLRGVNAMLGVRYLPHQPSHAFDDVSTPVFDRELVIAIPFHILETVLFPLPGSHIISLAKNISVQVQWLGRRGRAL